MTKLSPPIDSLRKMSTNMGATLESRRVLQFRIAAMAVVGTMLVTAAMLKAFQLTNGISPGKLQHQIAIENTLLGLTNPKLAWILVVVELVSGLLLLLRVGRNLVVPFALLLFFAFYLTTASKLLAGASSCGCFGELSVPPWITFMVDTLCITLLLVELICQASSRQSQPASLAWIQLPSLAISVIPTLFVTSTMLLFLSASEIRKPGSTMKGAQTVVHLESETWLGKRLPILATIDVKGQLSQGDWEVIFFNWDCQQCTQLIDLYRRHEFKHKIAFVELPPHRNRPMLKRQKPNHSLSSKALKNSPTIWGQVSSDVKWVGSTPIGIRLQNGIVVR